MHWLDDRAAHVAAHVRSVAFARTWMDGKPYRALVDRFDAVPAGDAEGALAAAETLLTDADAIGALLSPLIEALGDDPLFEPPFRVHRDRLRIGAVLFDHPAVSISAGVMSADALAALPPARTVVMTGRRSVVRYHRAAGAVLRRWRLDGDRCVAAGERVLADGEVLRVDGRCEASVLVASPRDVASVTATIRHGAGPVMRECAVADGAAVRTATLDDAVSRTTALLTLLRLSGRADAGSAFEAASRHPEHHLRWTAMREWLALDVAGALPRLEQMTDDPHPDVRAVARATLDVARAATCLA